MGCPQVELVGTPVRDCDTFIKPLIKNHNLTLNNYLIISHHYLYSTFYNTDCVKAALQY